MFRQMMLMRFVWAMAAIAAPAVSSAENAADALKIAVLEQDVRELKLQLQAQHRRIDSLEAQLSASRPALAPPAERPPAKTSDDQRPWLQIDNWDRVQLGASELELIQLLGPPTTLRKDATGDRQTLMYALEIGTGNFLTGSVIVENRRVVQVNKPTLQ